LLATGQAGYATLQTPQSALNFPNDSPLDPNLAEEIMHDVFGWGVGTDSWDPTSAWDMLNFGPGWNMAPLDDESLGLDEDGWTYGQRYDPMMSEAAQRGLTDGVPLRVGESEQPNGGSNDERADDETAWVSEEILMIIARGSTHPLNIVNSLTSFAHRKRLANVG
jgi:hypothetical protein